ncbi:MAG: ParA family protein [Rhodocyclaceae bacterium]|nr:ParA family protein [Rhodocyclaceae bacterium]
MKAFLVANPKGGSGKSTLSTNLAGYFASEGKDVMLGDIDTQQSSKSWLMLRPFSASHIDSWEVGSDKISRPPAGCSHVVLDTPAGLSGKMLERALKVSARVIIPVQPSIFDMLATRHFVQALQNEKSVRKGKADVVVIGMRVDPRTRAASELESFFATLGLPVLTYLRNTQIYVQAAAAGLSIFDLPPSRIERDLEQWQAIIDWANHP